MRASTVRTTWCTDGEYGAYLDAMGDKAFGVTALLALALQPGAVSTLPYWFRRSSARTPTLAASPSPSPRPHAHAALALAPSPRRQDSTIALPAVGRANCYTHPSPNR